VTGVQTCALPISNNTRNPQQREITPYTGPPVTCCLLLTVKPTSQITELNIPCKNAICLFYGQWSGIKQVGSSSNICIWVATSLKLGWGIDYPDWGFCGCLHSFQANLGIIPQTRPWSFPSTSFPIHYSVIILPFIQHNTVWTTDSVIKKQ
jgi:hypothetical protein